MAPWGSDSLEAISVVMGLLAIWGQGLDYNGLRESMTGRFELKVTEACALASRSEVTSMSWR